jgi:hypothetical protein
LNEKRPASKRRARAAGVAANSRRTWSKSHHLKREGHLEVLEVVAVDASQPQPAARRAWCSFRRTALGEEVVPGPRRRHRRQIAGRPAVKDGASLLSGPGTDVDDPVGMPDHVEVVLDHEERVARCLQPVERAQQGPGIGRVQPGRRLIEHVDHAEQVGAHLGGQPQALQLAGRKRGRAPIHRQVTEPELEENLEPRLQVLDDPAGHQRLLRMLGLELLHRARSGVAGLSQEPGQPREGQGGDGGHVVAGEGDCQRLGTQAPSVAGRTGGVEHVARDPPLDERALGGGKGLEHVAAGAGEGAHVAGLLLAAQGASGLGGREARVDGDHRLLVGEEDPVPVLLRQLVPGPVHVVTERHQDVAQVLPVPGRRPGSDGPLPDGERGIGDHGLLGHLEDPSEAVAARARTLRGVGREGLGLEHRLTPGIAAGAREEHAHQVRQRADAADRGARGGGTALLLQGQGRRQAVDGIHVGHRHLLEEPAGIGRDRLQIAALRLGVEGAEGQRRLA